MKARKCEMCGAPLNGFKCEYCGTSYDPEGREGLMYMTNNQNTAKLRQQLTNAQFASSCNAQTSSLATFYGSQISQCCCDLATQISQVTNAINAVSVTMNEARQTAGLLAHRKENI